MSISGLSGNSRAPTWSWVSSNGSVEYMFEGDDIRRTHMKLVDLAVESTSIGDEIGELLRVEIVLDGKLIPGTVNNSSYTTIPPFIVASIYYLCRNSGTTALFLPATCCLYTLDSPQLALPYGIPILTISNSREYISLATTMTGTYCVIFKKAYRERPSYTVSGMDNQVMCLPFMEFKRSFSGDPTDCYLLINKVRIEDNGQEVYRRFSMIAVCRKLGERFPFEDWPVTRFTFV